MTSDCNGNTALIRRTLAIPAWGGHNTPLVLRGKLATCNLWCCTYRHLTGKHQDGHRRRHNSQRCRATGAATTVYRTRPTMLELSGYPWLTDFGQMRVVEGRINQDWWMSDLYRAPEVLLQLPWGYPVDIWSIGVMTLELLEALAQYIGYLGPPPLEIIQKNPLFQTYFDLKVEDFM
ncbi:hypothetical protein BDV33DRAFT_209205 [Aspergillus novoparasiticus]|uniref:Protein kinase domain-containing protein n=1 Tax=Aspergillus novoparasiticus TaxID=986946 RepID=A0A5N6EB40_9EURO|nr:hypothetical protein BDV33DRAFT_209205 [Aspergillus novoparasiticus]